MISIMYYFLFDITMIRDNDRNANINNIVPIKIDVEENKK